MNKFIILSIILTVFLVGCSKINNKEQKKEVIQEKQEQDYIDPYIDEIN